MQHVLDLSSRQLSLRTTIQVDPRPTLTSCGLSMHDPLMVSRFFINANISKAGKLSSGSPSWMKCPSTRKSWRYLSIGISVDDTVETMMSSVWECDFSQSGSSLVAMKAVAPIFIASSILCRVRLIA